MEYGAAAGRLQTGGLKKPLPHLRRMFAPKRTKKRILVQIFEREDRGAFGDEKGPGFTAGALRQIYVAPQARCYPRSASTSVLPKRAGDGDTLIPAASMAVVLEPASPLPPEMIAPAWPMRRPGGAVTPAMKPAIGFLRPRLASSLMNWAASSSAEPPISPIMMIEVVLGSARNFSSISMNSVPLTGSPPMPTAVVWPRPSWVVWNTAS